MLFSTNFAQTTPVLSGDNKAQNVNASIVNMKLLPKNSYCGYLNGRLIFLITPVCMALSL